MNIRDWPLGSIIQLPDCCFGRRFPVSSNIFLPGPGTAWDISEVAFPETCVIWELLITAGKGIESAGQIRIALGSQLPLNAGMFDVLEPLFPGLGLQMPEPRLIYVAPGELVHLTQLRMPVATAGRKMVVQCTAGPGQITSLIVAIVVSSVPREVPDWLISGNLRSP